MHDPDLEKNEILQTFFWETNGYEKINKEHEINRTVTASFQIDPKNGHLVCKGTETNHDDELD